MGKNLDFSFLEGGKRIGSNKIESSQETQIQRDWSFQNWKKEIKPTFNGHHPKWGIRQMRST